MPRTVTEAKLDTRAARAKLKLGKMYWRTLETGQLHLGYTRKAKDQAGLWKVRRYKGAERYQIAPFAIADDLQDAGPGILTFAQAQREGHAYQWETGAPVVRRAGGPTVRDVIQDYLNWAKHHRATGHDAGGRAQTWILPKLGHRRVAELCTADYEQWLHWIAAQPAKLRSGKARTRVADPRARKATANRTFTILRAALNRAWRAGLVADDSAWRRVKPFGQTNAARPGFLTLVACQRLINAADEPSGFRDLVHAALLTGARYSELASLRVRDYVNGKVHVARSKTGRARNITLTPEGAEFFRQLTVGKAGDAVLLPRRNGAFGYWKKDEQQVPMKEACARAHVAITFHGLRHSYASLAVMSGMPLQVLAANLGHTSTRMCEQHYAHLTSSFVDETIRAHAPQFGLVRRSNVKALAE